MGCAASSAVYADSGEILTGKGAALFEPSGEYWALVCWPGSMQVFCEAAVLSPDNPLFFAEDNVMAGSHAGSYWLCMTPNTSVIVRFIGGDGVPRLVPRWHGPVLLRRLHDLALDHTSPFRRNVMKILKIAPDAEAILNRHLEMLTLVNNARQLPDELGEFRTDVVSLEDAYPFACLQLVANVRTSESYYLVAEDGNIREVQTKNAPKTAPVRQGVQDAAADYFIQTFEAFSRKYGVGVEQIFFDFRAAVRRATHTTIQRTAAQQQNQPTPTNGLRVDWVAHDTSHRRQWQADDDTPLEVARGMAEISLRRHAQHILEAARAPIEQDSVALVRRGSVVMVPSRVTDVGDKSCSYATCPGTTPREGCIEFGDNTFAYPTRVAVQKLPTAEDLEQFSVGQHVTARLSAEVFFSGFVVSIDFVNKNIYVEERGTQMVHCVPSTNCWIHMYEEQIALSAVLLRRHSREISVWWIEAEDPPGTELQRLLRYWREGCHDATLQSVPFEPVIETINKKRIFKGYCSKIRVLPFRCYCYNFLIGEDTFVAHGEKAFSFPNEFSFRKFVLEVDVIFVSLFFFKVNKQKV